MRKRISVQIKNVTYSPLDSSDISGTLTKTLELGENLSSGQIVVLKGVEDPLDIALYLSSGSSATFDTDIHAIGILNETGLIGNLRGVTFLWWKPFVEAIL